MDQGSTMKRSAVHNFAPTVTKFCVMWEGQALPHDTKFGNSRCEIVGRRGIFIWSLIHGLRWSGLIKAEPGDTKNQAMARHGTYHTLLVFKFVQVKTMCVSSAKIMTIPLHDINSSPPGENGHHFGKQHFHMNFLEWKWQNYDSNFSEICSLESNR